ncbi:unnamed protein product [Polarella glacialis]|uniref:Uncharacterized protein n=1 Tax=Polarella glacialis TaxID=89957 RepID=A0A813LF88_POLGL|nr:unnamed protein product [Polarella glacialis]
MLCVVKAIAMSPLLLITLLASADATTSDGVISAYEAFRAKHGRTESVDSASYDQRLALFAHRHAHVKSQNSLPGALWRAEINKFADHTDEEFKGLLGYRRLGEWWSSSSTGSSGVASSSFLQMKSARVIASTVDWRSNLTSSKFLREQGACGSCWAVAAVGALEMHAEIASKQPARKLSFKQLVDCTPNPQHCGGAGGCQGATAELAFKYVQENGLADADTYTGDINSDGKCQTGKTSVLQSQGFVKLPENKLQPLLDAVANEGPVVVSVDGGAWGSYAGGVFDGCQRDSTVNHAVLLVGYGRDAELGKDYWLIRNSWGAEWGEHGYIRLLRHSGDNDYCGTDRDPKQGVGCDGGPSALPVCGMCGLLSDSSYPKSVSTTM